MSLEIPQDPREAEERRQHDEERAEHIHTIEENEAHPEDRNYHHLKEAKAAVDAKIGHDEKADRRQEDERTAAMVDEVNAELD